MDQLSPAQRRIVMHPTTHQHALILAGPGSGKTRTITERIAYLIAEQQVAPEQILVMTFSNKAARELKLRLSDRLKVGCHGLWADTFHSIGARLLRTHGTAIGIPPNFSVCDQARLDHLLRTAAGRTGWIERAKYDFRDLQDAISRRKRSGLDREEQPAHAEATPANLLEILDIYQSLLRDLAALDFDDLILQTVQLLQQHADAANSVYQRFQYVFVDEFHDVAPDGYTFIKTLAPPRSPQRVMVVADPDQAIYSWLGAQAQQSLRWFQRDYRPVQYELAENYRSTGKLVEAAQQVRVAHSSTVAIRAIQPADHPIDYAECPSPDAEAAWIAKQIGRAHDQGAYTYDQIAVLYRWHSQGDLVEQALLAKDIPIRRVHPARLFDQSDIQMALRYLDLIASIHDDQFEPTLNWPRVLVDELTMIHLRQLAQAHNMSISALAQRIDDFAAEVSPLTRVAITEFFATIGAELLPVVNESIDVIMDRLLHAVNRRRSPLPVAERENLYGVLDLLARPLKACVDSLAAAIAAGRTVAIRHAGDLDSAAGAIILEHVLAHYLRHSVYVQPGADSGAEDEFVIVLGRKMAASQAGFGLAVRDARAIHYSVSTQAWRLGQMLLMRYETLRHRPLMIYDLETTSNQEISAEIVEVAAQAFVRGQAIGEPFNRLVRPQGQISRDASQLHGLTWQHVRHAPGIADVLPGFLEYLADATLVGHNIAHFDHKIVCRLAANLGLPQPTSHILDTLALARRVLPHTQHTLEALAHRFGATEPQTHRAIDDVQMNAFVLEHLLDLQQREQELDVLSETLPLVALGIWASGVPQIDENATLILSGARAAACGSGTTLVDQFELSAGSREQVSNARTWLTTQPHTIPEDDAAWTGMENRWRTMIGHYMRHNDDLSLQAFLHYAMLATMFDDRVDLSERVTLMTIHAAKGLEWPFVCIVGAEDDIFPSYRSKTEAAQDEDRRILYVGMTRAQQRLCISWAKKTNRWTKRVSPFLTSVSEEMIRRHVVHDDS